MFDSKFHQGIPDLDMLELVNWFYLIHGLYAASCFVKHKRAAWLTSHEANLPSAWTAFALAAMLGCIEAKEWEG